MDEISLLGAKGVLINITGGHDLTLFELDEAANKIREQVDPDANIIVGSTMDEGMGGSMRVSVVATGIDAVDVNTEMPVPRRSMSAPLPQTQIEDPADSLEVTDEAPVAAPTVAAATEEPSLFQDLNAQEQAAVEQAEDIFVEEDENGVPAPAYRPAAAAPAAPAFTSARITDEAPADAEPRAPGTPSPAAMDRLRNAVDRMPGGTQRPAAVPQPSEAAVAEERAPRFGINSLISKMTGAAETQPERAEQPAAPRAQPAVQRTQAAPAPEPEIEEAQDQDRIEIPAFLRRQAN